MKYKVNISDRARRDYDALTARWKSIIWDAMNQFLTHEPVKVSKSRIKRLRELRRPQYRLRVDTMRVFYDVSGDEVEVLAICTKDDAEQYLSEEGVSE